MPESGKSDQIGSPDHENDEAQSDVEETASGEQTTDEQFVEEMESDPARAGTDSPDQRLIGG